MFPSFNTTGPCIPGEHYMLPPERRLGRVLELIEERKYFTLHAGRQTGKTTSARWLVKHLNAGSTFHATWVDLETARERPDPKIAFATILSEVDEAVARDLPGVERPTRADIDGWLGKPDRALLNYLRALAARSPRPLVMLLDEADGLVGQSMVSFLTQLRTGYLDRSDTAFPSTIALIGLRTVRDYAVTEEDRVALKWLGTTSPFNVSAYAATLGPFTAGEVAELLAEHTAATGQRFEPEAVERIFDLGQGHPWLTNALADQIVNRDLTDRALPVTAAHVEAAKETIILERRSHIDSLIARLREPRIRKLLDAMLSGERMPGDFLDDDFAYVLGLGLIRMTQGGAEIANPIYREVIPRALTYVAQAGLYQRTAWYVRPDGGLDMGKLLAAFQEYWREDGHLAAEGFGYRESGPHLMLMTFLQRIVNGGGRIDREYGLGRRALDLLVTWQGERHAIEVKLRRDTETAERALRQVTDYLDRLGLSEGWLVMFDLRPGRTWEERLTTRTVEHAGKRVTILGC